MTASGRAGVGGSIDVGPASSDVARSISALPGSLAETSLTLQPQCGQTLDLSTFLIQGRGSTPAEPGSWDINFGLQP